MLEKDSFPWGSGKVSCIERCPHFRGKLSVFGTQQRVLNAEVSGVSFSRGSTILYSEYLHQSYTIMCIKMRETLLEWH